MFCLDILFDCHCVHVQEFVRRFSVFLSFSMEYLKKSSLFYKR